MHEVLAKLVAAPLASVMAVLAGVALGLMFYAGLWWTVCRAATFRWPGLSMLASLLLRMSVTLGGFYLVAGGDWARLLLCLAGFVLARAAVTWLTRLPSSATAVKFG
ncbi:MAG: ATP synthase subunit I [Burkholderiales bacterium]